MLESLCTLKLAEWKQSNFGVPQSNHRTLQIAKDLVENQKPISPYRIVEKP